MLKNYSVFRKLAFALTILATAGVSKVHAQATQTFVFTGATQTFVVPSCVSTITFDVRGAEGGDVNAVTAGFAAGTASISGGDGGRVQAVLNVVAGDVLYINVGGKGTMSTGGFNGGGAPGACNGTEVYGAGGGGASDIRKNGLAFGNRVIVAGGGGGASGSGSASYQSTNNTGAGGGLIGGNATNSQSAGFQCINGLGGTQVAGGIGGNNSCYCNLAGVAPSGSLGLGGNVICAPSGLSTCACNGTGCTSGGGGGGGYYGGGAGIAIAAGGGGSSYTDPLALNVVHTQGFQTGNGIITFSYNFSGAIVGVVASPTVICAGGTTTLNSGGGQVSYTWSPGGANSSTLSVSPVTNTTYTLQGTNSLGCISTATLAVPVNTAVPTLTVVNSANMVCAGKTSTLTASGATTYTWAGGSNPPNGVGFIPAATTDYTVTGENACGTSTAVASITVNPLPNITASASNPTVCTGNTSILNGTGSASGYTWTNGVTNNVAFSPAVTNTYVVTGVSAQGCTNTAAVTVSVFITPTVVPVASPTAICAGKTATLSSIGATSGYTWSTTPPVYTSSVAVSPLVSTIYTVTRASGACVSTSTINLVVNPLPNLQVSTPNPSVVCANSAASLAAAGAITYTWFPGGFQGSNITVYPNYSAAPIDYTVIASNANCTISAVSTISTNPNPIISVAASSSVICAGSTATLTANGAVSYTWQSPVPAGQQNQAVVTVNPLIPTLYNLSGTNSFGCVSGGNQVILVNAAPNLTTNIVNPGGYICANGMATLTAIGTGPTNFNWLNTGATLGTIMVNPPTSTIYTVVGTNPTTGCQSVGTLSLAVYISTFVVSSPTAVCKGSTVTLSANGAASSYTWIAGIPVASNTPSVSVSPQLTTLYNVVGSTGNCTTTQTVNLIVHQVPNVSASAVKPTICRYEPGALIASGATSYSWTGGPGTAGYTVFPTVTSTYVVTGTDNNNCSKTVIVTQLVATCIGLEEQSLLDGQLSIYPNPNNGVFTIQSATPVNISIVNELGQVVKTFSLSKQENTVNVTDLSKGLYFMSCESNGAWLNKKIIIE